MKDSGDTVPSKYLWSADEVARASCDHRNDANWNPQELKGGGYVVKTLEGMLVPAPETRKETNQ